MSVSSSAAAKDQDASDASDASEQDRLEWADVIMLDPLLVSLVLERARKPKASYTTDREPHVVKPHTFKPQIEPSLILNHKVSPGAFRLACWMKMQAKGNTICKAGQERIAAELSVTVRTIRRWIDELEGAGLLETDIDARKNADNYTLRF